MFKRIWNFIQETIYDGLDWDFSGHTFVVSMVITFLGAVLGFAWYRGEAMEALVAIGTVAGCIGAVVLFLGLVSFGSLFLIGLFLRFFRDPAP
jgi:hypothetical protein